MNGRASLGATLLITCVVSAALAACGGRASAPSAPTAGAITESSSSAAPSTPEPLPRKMATLYFPSSESGLLAAESREILATRAAEDRAKQILSDLLSGPTEAGLAAAVPAGTRLLQVYVLSDGTAYADFSGELRLAIEAGSDNEIATVYSIINSLTINVPEIDRVGILIEGRPCQSLSGHLGLTQ